MTLVKKNTRNIGLDILRSVAILFVLANHGLIGFFIHNGHYQWDGVLAQISLLSVVAIEWLFVLSGFLIGTIMIRSFSKESSWWKCSKDFWLRRWFRTIPNYYLFLIINILLIYFGVGEGSFSWLFVFFSQSLFNRDESSNFFGESWSLALDEWFYFLMPIFIGCIFLLKKISVKNSFIIVSLLLILFPAFLRYIYGPVNDVWEWDAEIRRVTIYHLDATGWGVLGAVFNNWYKDKWDIYFKKLFYSGMIFMIGGMAMIWILPTPEGWGYGVLSKIFNTISISLMALGSVLILPALTKIEFIESIDRILRNVVEKLSEYSYSIYLSHMPILFLIKFLFLNEENNSIIYNYFLFVIWLFSVYLLSSFVFNFFEWPISKLRDKFTKKTNTMPL